MIPAAITINMTELSVWLVKKKVFKILKMNK